MLDVIYTYLTYLIPIGGFPASTFLLVRYRALLPSTLESTAPADQMSQTVQAAPRFFQAMAREKGISAVGHWSTSLSPSISIFFHIYLC